MTKSINDVVVVGAGPVGLVTAIGLAQRGVKVIVLEQNSAEVAPQWRGSTIHPPTLEIFDQLGLAETIINGAVKVELLQYRDLELPDVVNFKYSSISGLVKFPYRLQYEQYKVLKLLRDTAAELENIELRYQAEVKSVTASPASVLLELETLGVIEQLETNWLVAADGSHSKVRKSIGIELSGFTYPLPTTVVATAFPFENYFSDLAPVSYWSGPLGRLSMIRTPDIWRIAMTTQAVDDSTERGTIEKPAADFVAAINLLLKLIPGTTLSDLDLKQYEVYRSHQRVAAEFSFGRVALAGDAAHLTSTNGGMGLNSGVQDAAALVTALLAAIAENSTEPITSYASARKQFCERFLQPTTTANHETVDNPDQATRAARLAKLAAQAADPAQELAAVAKASMLTDLALQN